MRHAHIAFKPNGEILVTTPRIGGDAPLFRFPDLACARLFCVLCDFPWAMSAPPFELKPPRDEY